MSDGANVSGKTITTVREYGAEGRLIRETITEHTQQPDYWVDDTRWWQQPTPWWQNPPVVISSYTTMPTIRQASET